MTASLLSDACAQHVRATARLSDTGTALTPAQLQTPAPGTFGSSIDTFRHLVAGDSLCLSVLSGEATAPIDEEPSLVAPRSVMTSNGTAWTELLAGELDPDEGRVDRDDDGTECWGPMGLGLAQVLHHGTDRRSQICTALTSLGLTPRAIDSGASPKRPVASGWCPRRPSRCRSPTQGQPEASIGPEQAVGMTERSARQTTRPRRALRR